MAPELEMGGGLGLGMGLLDLGLFPHSMMLGAFSTSSSTSSAAYNSCGSAACGGIGDAPYLYGLLPTPQAFPQVDDLLDFSAKDGIFDSAAAATAVAVGSNYAYHGNVQPNHHHLLLSNQQQQHPQYQAGYGAAASAATGNYSLFSGAGHHHNHSSSSVGSDLAAFPDDLYIPSEEAAELEWLSKFVDDSSDVPFHIPGATAAAYALPPATATATTANSNTNLQYTTDAPATSGLITGADTTGGLITGRARTKRTRVTASTAAQMGPEWLSASHLPSPSSSSCSSSDTKQPRMPVNGGKNKRVAEEGPAVAGALPDQRGGVLRRCTHCSSEKTPQWRTGPLGPKTLCNACGVRYKSGRLVPEYRPASSPTFVLTQHSNSHRKVMELRRQKEMVIRHHHHIQHQHHENASPLSAVLTASATANIPSPVLPSTTRPDLLLRDFQVC